MSSFTTCGSYTGTGEYLPASGQREAQEQGGEAESTVSHVVGDGAGDKRLWTGQLTLPAPGGLERHHYAPSEDNGRSRGAGRETAGPGLSLCMRGAGISHVWTARRGGGWLRREGKAQASKEPRS